MKKIILSVCVIVSSFAAANAQNGKPVPPPVPVPTPVPSPVPSEPPVIGDIPGQAAATPKVQNIEFLQFKEVVFDFGNIKAGIPASHVFEYKNVGNRDITIDNVNASCGCTTPNWKGGIYKPGQTGQVTATYNAASVGSFNKNVTVTSSEGSIVLTITGNVMDAGSYDAWKVQKDADDALKAQEAAAKSKSKGNKKSKGKSKTAATPATPATPAKK